MNRPCTPTAQACGTWASLRRMTPEPNIPVRIQRLPHAEGLALPSYETEGAAGMDVRAAVTDTIMLAPGAIMLVPTGLVLEVPPGFEMQVRPRSGLAAKHGITLPNSPATIDSDYRGEVRVIVQNLGPEPFAIERGLRIGQFVLQRVPRVQWVEAAELSATSRGAGGFGHTGTS
jgi:dUTP pyrophosphatase